MNALRRVLLVVYSLLLIAAAGGLIALAWTQDKKLDLSVQSFNLQAQNSNPFTVELDLGQIQGTPNVKVRAHCNMHGWSDWSSEVQVPEFSEVGVTVLAALAAALLITRRKRNR